MYYSYSHDMGSRHLDMTFEGKLKRVYAFLIKLYGTQNITHDYDNNDMNSKLVID